MVLLKMPGERGLAGDQSNKSAQLQNGLGREPDEIEILDTDTLIKKEHEQALISVIEKLADSSNSERGICNALAVLELKKKACSAVG